MSVPSKSQFGPSAKEIAHVLHGKRCGKGYLVRCVGHKDKRASLSVRDGADGKLLLHCFAGCRFEDIAAGLQAKGLLPERRWLSDAEYRQQHRERVERRERERQAELFCLALEPLLIELLAGLPPVETIAWDEEDPARLALTGELARLRRAQDRGLLVELFLEWQRRDPELTAGLVHAGLWREFRWSARLWRWWNAQQQLRRAAA